jgi:hypothetical protein
MKKYISIIVLIAAITGVFLISTLISDTQSVIIADSQTTLKTGLVKSVSETISDIKSGNGTFEPVDIFSVEKNQAVKNQISKFVNNPTILKLNVSKLSEIYKAEHNNISLNLKFDKGNSLELELTRVQLLETDFKVNSLSEGRITTPKEYKPGLYYNGIIKGDNKSIAAISIFENEVIGIISNAAGNYNLGMNRTIKDESNYVLYNDADILLKTDFVCPVGDMMDKFYKGNENHSPKHKEHKGGDNSTLPVKMYFECDYQMYQDAGYNTTTLVNFVSGAFNAVKAIYQNEFIPFTVSSITYWSAVDPYANLNDSYDILLRFGGENKDFFQGNLAHLLSTGHNQQLGGIAWIRVLCQEYNNYDSSGRFGFSNIEYNYNGFPVYSWTVNVITHEVGHNLGSMHTHACWWPRSNGSIGAIDSCYNAEAGFCFSTPRARVGTIMSYCHLWSPANGGGVNLSLGFGPLPGDTIRLRYNQAGCLERELNSSEIPISYLLDQNYPNPFNPVTNIRFSLPENSKVTLRVFDISGKEITRLVDGQTLNSGTYSRVFDAGKFNLASGIYFYQITAISSTNGKVFNEVRKMVFTK